MKFSNKIIFVIFALISFSLRASDVGTLQAFVPNTPAKADEVNKNFTDIKTAVNSKQDRLTNACPSGQFLRSINADGSPGCAVDNAGVTAISASGGITSSGGTTPTLGLNLLGGDGTLDFNVTTSLSWTGTSVPPVSTFKNFTIYAGQTLTVEAGMTIRCSGTFTNNGTIVVSGAYAPEGGVDGYNSAYVVQQSRGAHPGDTPVAASNGTRTVVVAPATTPTSNSYGTGGIGIRQQVAMTSFRNFSYGGGGGGSAAPYTGGNGGGLLRILCNGAVVNNGSIQAKGTNGDSFGKLGSTIYTGAGGGGGGIVILASMTSVTNNGSASMIDVSGGVGGTASASVAPGGGGAGGIIVMVSPQINNDPARTNVAAGAAGTATTATLSTAYQQAGGGGGGSGGNGGFGGSYGTAATTHYAAGAGSAGYFVTIVGNPLSLMY